ncbi:MAG: hypothetical protein MRY77_18815, partial [Rhodobacteraceae bacterium]|nr:hypothetical protein [Paracoccaceae bacterium]
NGTHGILKQSCLGTVEYAFDLSQHVKPPETCFGGAAFCCLFVLILRTRSKELFENICEQKRTRAWRAG